MYIENLSDIIKQDLFSTLFLSLIIPARYTDITQSITSDFRTWFKLTANNGNTKRSQRILYLQG